MKVPDKKTGLKRMYVACLCSFAGLRAAFDEEEAFRQEVYFSAPMTVVAFFLGRNVVETLLLVSTLFMVMIIELCNSAIEATVDRGGMDYHCLAKRAKDTSSAAVFVAIVLATIVWLGIFIDIFFG